MTRALIFSDLHIHAHKASVNRLQHCVEVLDWVFRQAAEQDCQYIFFLGDLFHDRAKIDVLNYLRTFDVFMEHMLDDAHDREMWLLVGNHDMYHKERWDINSVKPLTAIPRVHIVDKPTRMTLCGRTIDWMPHTDNPVKELNKLKKQNGGGGDILLGHMAVNGALLNLVFGTTADVIVEYDNEMVPVDVSVFDDWGMTFLGHYHGAQPLNKKVEYIGSPLELTFGEAFQDKHVAILDLESLEKYYVKNKFSPKHLIITPKDVRDETYDLGGNFVRITVDELNKKEVIDLKRSIAETYSVLSLDTKHKDKKSEEDQTVIENARAILMNIDQMLDIFIDQKGIPDGLERAKLIACGRKCLEKRTSS